MKAFETPYFCVMLSFWEETALLPTDVIVVGGGITGLSAALSIKEHDPHLKVKVLERGIFPFGASTRNAGFACFGSAAEIIDDIRHDGKDRALALVEKRVRGLEKLRRRIPDTAMNFQWSEGGELVQDEANLNTDSVHALNRDLWHIFGKDVFQWAPQKVTDLGFSSLVKGFIANPFEASIHSGRMMLHLQHLCRQFDVEVMTGITVQGMESDNGRWLLDISQAEGLPAVTLSAPRVLLATNAFTRGFLPDMDIIPGRGQVWVTQPIPQLKLKGIVHADAGFVYFRELEGRVLIGGARNVDLEGEQTFDFGRNRKVSSVLNHYLNDIILPNQPWELDYEWSGIMAFGHEKNPIIQALEPGLVVVARMSGMGVALASLAAEEGVRLLLGK